MDPVALSEVLPQGEALEKLTGYGVTNVSQLAQMFTDTKAKLDGSARVPGPNDPPEAWAAYYKRIGRPDTPDEYKIPEPAQKSQLGQTLDVLKTIAHQSGLTHDQWNGLVDGATGFEQQREQQVESVKNSWQQQAREQFGDKHETIVAKGNRILTELTAGDDTLSSLLEQTGIAQHPKLLEALAKVADITSPDTAPAGMEGQIVGDPRQRGLELKDEIGKLMASEAWPRGGPGHEMCMSRYYQIQEELGKLGFDGATDPRLNFDYASPQ